MEEKMRWEVISECNDDEGNPTVWAMEFRVCGVKQGYYYIEKWSDNEFHVDFEGSSFAKRSSYKSLTWAMKTCEENASKMRWCYEVEEWD